MTTPNTNLSGHVALVTGSRRGIGRGIARRLAAHGAAVIISADPTTTEGASETADMIRAAGGTADIMNFDLADADSRSTAIEQAGRLFGPVDILVNNAAMSQKTNASVIDLAARRQIFEVNFQAPIDLIQQALPAMRDKRWGRIVNISSETVNQSPIPYPAPQYVHTMVAYGASKAALDRYSLGLAAELHATGIHVNSLRPYRVCITEENSAAALAGLRAHPDWAETVEMMAEAAYIMVSGSCNGLALGSRETLALFQQPLHALDGKTVIGDATTIPDLEKITAKSS